MYLLLCGCGAGLSMQRHHVDRLPSIEKPVSDSEQLHFIIPDTIEGWADAVNALMASFFVDGMTAYNGQDSTLELTDALGKKYLPEEFVGKRVSFDYTRIRPEGAKIQDGLASAPGPEPLRFALTKIRKLLNLAADADCTLEPH
jgi:ribonucleoside-triphosphate reductase